VTVDYTYDRRRRLIEESAVTDTGPAVPGEPRVAD
jgi:hypothetical protein